MINYAAAEVAGSATFNSAAEPVYETKRAHCVDFVNPVKGSYGREVAGRDAIEDAAAMHEHSEIFFGTVFLAAATTF